MSPLSREAGGRVKVAETGGTAQTIDGGGMARDVVETAGRDGRCAVHLRTYPSRSAWHQADRGRQAWIWVAIPVPTTESTSTALDELSALFLRGAANRGKEEPHEPLPLDVSFLFFLLWYYGTSLLW